MTEYKKLSKEECRELLLGIERPLILCHVRPDADTVGSAKALALIFAELGKEAKILCADPIPERLRFIVDDGDVADTAQDRELIAIDVASPAQLGKLDYLADRVALTIDHHSSNTPFSPHYTLPDVSSAAEVLMEIIDLMIEKGEIKMTKALAEALYTAISSDTGCFCYSNAISSTHRRAAELLDTGIDSAAINHRLFHTKRIEQIQAESLVGSRIRTAFGGRVAYVCLTEDDVKSNPLGKEAFECAIDIVRALEGAEIAITVKESSEGLYKVSLRSTGKNVSEVASAFGGGGHLRAAGCSVSAVSKEEAIKKILIKIKEIIKL